MAAGYNYLQNFISPSVAQADEWQKFTMAVLLGAGMILVGKKAAARLSSASGTEQALVPSERPSLFGFVDFLIESFVKFQDSVLGHHGRKYLPFTGTLFFFLLIGNLLGLIPGVPAMTTTVWVNVGIALVVFFYFNSFGVREHGIVGYLKHFAAGPILLAPFLFPLEIFSTILRVITLNLRLYWNISADHLVLHIFTEMLGPLAPVPLYILGTFVCFMQAVIFTTLTMVYILLATQHEEGH